MTYSHYQEDCECSRCRSRRTLGLTDFKRDAPEVVGVDRTGDALKSEIEKLNSDNLRLREAMLKASAELLKLKEERDRYKAALTEIRGELRGHGDQNPLLTHIPSDCWFCILYGVAEKALAQREGGGK